jgi:dihydrofolate reductase
MKIISHLVAVSNNGVIGVDNDLPWNLKADLAHFREYTLNKTIVMGRKTFESIGRPLPKRTNYVVSRTIESIPGAHVFKSLDDAFKSAEGNSNEADNELVIIGGGYLFRDTIDIFNKLLITRVDCDIEGDVFYPELDLSKWSLLNTESFNKDHENDYNFKIEEYSRL